LENVPDGDGYPLAKRLIARPLRQCCHSPLAIGRAPWSWRQRVLESILKDKEASVHVVADVAIIPKNFELNRNSRSC
jgi:hypothetical protein